MHSLPNTTRLIKSRSMRCTERVVHVGEMRNSCKVLVRKPEGKRPVEIRGHKLGNNIKTNL
jgi:hypothetical protein